MAFLRDKVIDLQTSNLNNITTDITNLDYEAGDTLVLCVSKDTTTGGDLGTPAGWTKLGGDVTNSTAVRGALFYRENVPANVPNPAVTSTDTDTWASWCASIGGAPASNVIDASTTWSENFTSHEASIPSLTTQSANTLVLWAIGTDGAGQIYNPKASRLINYDDGVGCTAGGFWATKLNAGATGAFTMLSGGVEQTVGWVVSIKDGSGGADVPGVVEGGVNESNLVLALQGIETNTYAPTGIGSDIAISSLIGTFQGRNILDMKTLVDQTDAASVPYARAPRMEADRQNDTGFALSWNLDVTNGTAAFDVSDPDHHLFFMIHHRDAKLQAIGGLANDFGTAILLHDSGGDWAAYGVDGRDSNRKLDTANAGPVIIDPTDTVRLAESGTLNDNALRHMTVAAFAALSNNYYTHLGGVYICHPWTLVGGSSNIPANLDDIIDYGRRLNVRPLFREGFAYTAYAIIKLGNGTDGLDCNLDGDQITFAARDNACHIADGHFGLIVDTAAGNSISAVGSSWASETPFRFDLSSAAGTVNFQRANVIGATPVTLSAVVDMTDATFTGCGEIDANGAELTGATIDSSTATPAITISSQAELDNMVGVKFTNNNVAIVIDAAGSLTLSADNVTFTGNTVDIVYTGTGTLTWQNLNGSDAASSSAPGGGTVIIESPAVLTFTGMDAGSTVRVWSGVGGTLLADLNEVAGQAAYAHNGSGTVFVQYTDIDTKIFNLTIVLAPADSTIPLATQFNRQYKT